MFVGLYFRYSCFISITSFTFPCITIFDKSTLIEHFYIRDSNDREKFEKLLKDFHSRVVFYIMIDLYDVDYICEFFNKLKPSLRKELLANKMEIDMQGYEFKANLPVKSFKSKKEDNYIFIGINISNRLKTYIRYVDSLPYLTRGMYLLSVETINLVRLIIKEDIKDVLLMNDFHVFLLQLDSLNYRSVVLKGNDFILSRLINFGETNDIDTNIANMIEEIENTINYTLKLYHKNSVKVSLHCIVKEDIASAIRDISDIKISNIYIHNFKDIIASLKMNYAKDMDNFNNADVFLAYAFLKQEPILQFDTKKTKKIFNFISSAIIFDVFSIIIACVAVIMLATFSVEIVYDKILSHNLSQENKIIIDEYNKLSNQYKVTPIEMQKIDKILSQYNKMEMNKKNSLSLVYISAISKIISTSSYLSLKGFEVSKQKNNTFLNINAFLNFKGMPFQEASNRHKDMVKKIKELFTGCKVTVSEIPISISDKGIESAFPIDINIAGTCYAH